jgi:hypothetical protein
VSSTSYSEWGSRSFQADASSRGSCRDFNCGALLRGTLRRAGNGHAPPRATTQLTSTAQITPEVPLPLIPGRPTPRARCRPSEGGNNDAIPRIRNQCVEPHTRTLCTVNETAARSIAGIKRQGFSLTLSSGRLSLPRHELAHNSTGKTYRSKHGWQDPN